jgi:hypothetical protein
MPVCCIKKTTGSWNEHYFVSERVRVTFSLAMPYPLPFLMADPHYPSFIPYFFSFAMVDTASSFGSDW